VWACRYCYLSPEDGGNKFLRNVGVTTQKNDTEIISNVKNDLKLPRGLLIVLVLPTAPNSK
jgi:hypothetical protein